jgi:hypothetical protein
MERVDWTTLFPDNYDFGLPNPNIVPEDIGSPGSLWLATAQEMLAGTQQPQGLILQAGVDAEHFDERLTVLRRTKMDDRDGKAKLLAYLLFLTCEFGEGPRKELDEY